MDSDATQAVIEVEPSELEFLKATAAENGVSLEGVPQEGLEPITTATLILLGTALAVSTVVYLLDRRRGGQVIDLRPGAPQTFYRTADVEYGLVVLITSAGDVNVEVKEPKGMFGTVVESITSLLPKLPSGNPADLSGAIQARLGAAVTVTTGPD